jgi:inosose dehydratase
MAIETGRQIDRLLDASAVGLCLDTGHAYSGGADPVAIARSAPDRVLHVHLKDVDPAKADRVRSGEMPFRQSVIDGLFVPLGEGAGRHRRRHRRPRGCRLPGLVRPRAGRLAQGRPAPGEGPKADAIESVAYLSRHVGGRA